MRYELKPLSCDPAKLSGLSEKLIVSHWENNYGGAVKRLNAIEQKLAELNWAAAPVFEINGLKWEEMIASGSMILHEVYFDSLGGAGGGSCWTLLAWSPRRARLVNAWAADHAHNLAGAKPLVALDMYEHSYHMGFGAKAMAYVDAFMQSLSWTAAEAEFAKVEGLA